MRKTHPTRSPFCPRFPLYLLSRTGRPLVSVHGDGKAAIGFSNRRLAQAAGHLLLRQGAREIGVLSVSTAERFQQVVSQLKRHEVTHMIWDDLGDSPTREVIDLAGIE